ncbi:MAG: TIR domain-containing protein [Candidatus Baltobacteraceae bacterium]
MDPDVFICHSSVDARRASDICALLEAGGVQCWIAPRDPIPGIPYGQQIVGAIAKTPVVLLVFSAHSNESRPVLGELELASNRGKIILPVRIDDVLPGPGIEFYIRPIHWFDAATRSFEDVAPELVRDVRALLGKAATAQGSPADAPAQPKASRAPINNIPFALTSFVGRGAEIAEVEANLKTSRLVTLCGPGGIGKTCIAQEVGRRQVAAYPDGVCFVDLAPVENDASVLKRLADAFDLEERPNRPIADALLSSLKQRTLLIILDNCEHVVAEAARVAETILQTCANIAVLATSRELLGIGGERTCRVPGLAVPPADPTRTLKAEVALTFDAIALFAERAQAADGRFTLRDEDASAVANICRRLDGIALAIELAAARVRLLSVDAIAMSLDERFQVLTGGARTALPRQKTLRATIDWSYESLSKLERVLFRRLSVFAGSFSLELATAVCADDEDAAALDSLASLVDKSLVQADFNENEVRYRLLESMRAYAREKLIKHDELESITRKHAIVYLKLAEKLESARETTPDVEWKARAEPEMENWRAALRWTLGSGGDGNLGQELAASLYPVWFTMAASEGRRWIQAALEMTDGDTPRLVVAKLSLAEAHLAMLAQQYGAALPAAERAMQLYAQLADRQGAALARMFVGGARGFQGDLIEGVVQLELALEEFRRLGSTRAIPGALSYLGTLQVSAGNVAAARPLFSEALGILKSLGAAQSAAHIALYLAEGEFRDGNALQAVSFIGESIAAHRSLNDLDALTFALVNLAAYLVSLDRWDEAAVHAREALSLSLQREITSATVWALQHLAAISALRPNSDHASALDGCRRAARILGFVDSRIVELDMRPDFTEKQELARVRAAIDGALGAEAAGSFEDGRNSIEGNIAAEALRI